MRLTEVSMKPWDLEREVKDYLKTKLEELALSTAKLLFTAHYRVNNRVMTREEFRAWVWEYVHDYALDLAHEAVKALNDEYDEINKKADETYQQLLKEVKGDEKKDRD